MANKVKFRVHYHDLEGVLSLIDEYVDIPPGETREMWVSDILKNGIRLEGKEGIRRIAPSRVLAVDYERA